MLRPRDLLVNLLSKIMLDIGIGLGLEENSVLAAEEAIKQAKAKLKNSSKINLALVFSSGDFSAAGTEKAFRNLLGGIPLIGASGPAIISEKGIFKHGITVLLLGLPEEARCATAVTREITQKKPFNCGKELSEKLLLGFKNIPRNLGILLFDHLINEGPEFISGVQENLGKSFPCFGASFSSNLDPARSWLYLNNEVITGGCAGLLLGGKITSGLGIKHGWKPLGKPHKISSAVGNIINSIDDKPAIELYKDYLDYSEAELKEQLNKLSVSYPIGVFIPGEEEYLLRNIISVEDRGALVCQGSIPEGTAIRLMISTQETCLDAAARAIKEARDSLSGSLLRQSGAKISRFAIVFSSFSRYNLFRRDIKKEFNLIKKELSGVPVLGIYTHGDLAPLTSGNYHGQTYFRNQDFSVVIIEG